MYESGSDASEVLLKQDRWQYFDFFSKFSEFLKILKFSGLDASEVLLIVGAVGQVAMR